MNLRGIAKGYGRWPNSIRAWFPPQSDGLNELMSTFDGPWFLIGGWAIDAWLGRQSRDHGDVDIGYFRDSEQQVFRHLAGWHMAAHDTPDADHDDEWDGHALDFPAHIHARKPGWPELDLNANERVGDEWIVNADPRLTVRIGDAIREYRLGRARTRTGARPVAQRSNRDPRA